MGKTNVFLTLLLFTLLSVRAQQFVHTFLNAPGSDSGTVTWIDFDGDGDRDLLITGLDASGVSHTFLYENNGEGEFSIISGSGLPDLSHSSVAKGDVNGDGYEDLLMLGYSPGGATFTDIYTNNANGTFTPQNIAFAKVYDGSCNFTDVNNDGYPDVFISGFDNAGAVAKLYVNDQNGSFTEASNTGIQAVYSSASAWADFDGDGWQDLFLCGGGFPPDPDIALIYKNNGDNTFTVLQSLTEVRMPDVALKDYDGDGDMDLLYAGYNFSSSSRLSFLLRNDGGTFTQVANNIIGVSNPALAWADYNMDGNADIFIAGAHQLSSDQLFAKLYTNNGNDAFEEADVDFPGLMQADAAWADIDGDTDMDLVYSGTTDIGKGNNHTYVFRNDIINYSGGHLSEAKITIYPNPVRTSLYLPVFHHTFDKVSILDILGQKVWEKRHFSSNQIKLRSLKPGIYFLQLEEKGETLLLKFVKSFR